MATREYNRQYHQEHKAEIKERKRLYRQRNKGKMKVLDRASYLRNAESKRQLSRDKYYRNREKLVPQQKEWRKSLKIEVLTHYGGGEAACVTCGENRLACLSIDHINGGGAKLRHERKISSGPGFYSWLKQNGFPEGHQTLCMNCQFIKREENHEVPRV